MRTRKIISKGIRKKCSVVFVELTNFYTQFSSVSLSDQGELIWGYLFEIEELANKYEGSVYKFHWLRRIMVLFGVPKVHKDDEERAYRFALDVKNLARKWHKELKSISMNDPVLNIRIGINTGFVYYGIIGHKQSKYATVIGDTVNLAARLCSIGGDKDIYTTGSEVKVYKDIFKFEKGKDMKIKGKKDPVRVYRLLGYSKIGKAKIKSFPFVDREKEIALLDATLEGYIREGKNKNVLVIGDHGMGKTSIIKKFRKDKSVPIYHLSCFREGSTIHYKPFKELLTRLFNILPADSEGLMIKKIENGLHELDPSLLEEAVFFEYLFSIKEAQSKVTFIPFSQRKKRITFSFVNLMKALAKKKAVMVLDDYQDIDRSSKVVISQAIITEKVPMMYVFVSLPKQDKLMDSIDKEVVRIGGLPRDYAVKVLKQYKLFDDKTIDLIVEKTNGNPFFIVEIIRYKMANPGKEIWEKEILQSVYSVIMERIDSLPSKLKSFLFVCSVMGISFYIETLERIIGENIKKNIQDLCDYGILYVNDGVAYFAHSLVRQVAYHSILLEERKGLHKLAAESIEKYHMDRIEDFYEILAYHYLNASVTEKAIDYTLLSAEKAKRFYANEVAIEEYQKAIKLMEEVENRKKDIPVVLESIGNLYNVIGEFEKAIQYFDKSIKISVKDQNSISVITSIEGIGMSHLYKGEYDISLQFLTRAKQLAESKKIEYLLPRIQSNIGYLFVQWGDFFTSLIYYNNSFNLWKKIGNLEEQTQTLKNIAELHIKLGNYQLSYETLRFALNIVRNKRTEVELRLLMGILYLEIGMLPNAISFFEESVNLSKKIGDRVYNIRSNIYLSYAKFADNKKETINSLSDSLKEAEVIGSKPDVVLALYYISLVYIDLGMMKKASKTVLKGLRTSEIINDRVNNIRFLILLAKLENSKELGTKAATKAKELNSPILIKDALFLLGEMEEKNGEIEKTLEYYSQAQSILQGIVEYLSGELKSNFLDLEQNRRIIDKVSKMSDRKF